MHLSIHFTLYSFFLKIKISYLYFRPDSVVTLPTAQTQQPTPAQTDRQTEKLTS